LSVCLCCTACVAAGTQVRENQLSQFHKGRSTEADVEAALGAPNQNMLLPDGSRMICYTYVRSTSRPENFIPYVGAFVGGMDTHSNSTCFQFADNGLLKGYTCNSTQSGAGYGLEAGSGMARVPSEPKQAN
jgi:hypothetical protein